MCTVALNKLLAQVVVLEGQAAIVESVTEIVSHALLTSVQHLSIAVVVLLINFKVQSTVDFDEK